MLHPDLYIVVKSTMLSDHPASVLPRVDFPLPRYHCNCHLIQIELSHFIFATIFFKGYSNHLLALFWNIFPNAIILGIAQFIKIYFVLFQMFLVKWYIYIYYISGNFLIINIKQIHLLTHFDFWHTEKTEKFVCTNVGVFAISHIN